jgi:uncharacterized protein YchJ
MGYMRAITAFYGFDELDPGYKVLLGIDDNGQYTITEEFCDNPSCKCKNVLVRVFRNFDNCFSSSDEVAAFICDLKTKGVPELEERYKKSDLTEYFSERVESMMNDPEYIARLEKHYQLVKIKARENSITFSPQVKIGRNEPCPCGSGIKYKKCCLLTG